jgi:hypothetical protein
MLHLVIRSFNHWTLDLSTIRSSDYLVVQSFDRLCTRPIDHLIIRSLDPLETDYTRLTIADWETDYSRMTMVHHITYTEKIVYLVKELLLSMIGIWISFDYLIIRLLSDHSIIQSLNHSIRRSFDHLIIRFSIFLHSIVRSLDHSITRSPDHSITRSFLDWLLPITTDCGRMRDWL